MADDLPKPAEAPPITTFDQVLALGVLGAERFRQAYPDQYERLRSARFARYEFAGAALRRFD